MFKLSERSKSNMKGVNPKLIEIVVMAISISNVDFGIPSSGGLRTAEEQNALYKAGASKADGYKILSKHQSGNAVDVFGYSNGKIDYSPLAMNSIAAAMLQSANKLGYTLEWSGFWVGFKEQAHFQLVIK